MPELKDEKWIRMKNRTYKSSISHDKKSDRVYLMDLDPDDFQRIIAHIEELPNVNQYSKLFAKVPAKYGPTFLAAGYIIVIALYIPSVLELMFLSYAFMVSGLLAPVLGFLLFKKPSRKAAIIAMISGCGTLLFIKLTGFHMPWALDAVVPSLLISLSLMLIFQWAESFRNRKDTVAMTRNPE
jgi:hypothetical protein